MIGSPTRAACIDIGSNTTRLLVAEVVEGTLNRLEARRAFTHLRAGLAVGGALEPERVAAAAEAVAEQAQAVRELGSPPLRVVATAALRRASDSEALIAAVRERAGVEVEVLTAEDEARLVFAGAVGCLTAAPRGELAV